MSDKAAYVARRNGFTLVALDTKRVDAIVDYVRSRPDIGSVLNPTMLFNKAMNLYGTNFVVQPDKVDEMKHYLQNQRCQECADNEQLKATFA